MPDNAIHCVIVDDEPPAQQILQQYVSAIPTLHLVATCNNAVEAIAVLQKNKVDLLLLDIQMPHILGTDFVKTLIHPPQVIFTTAHRNFALDGFELDAVDFLLKPISFERFLKAIHKVMQKAPVEIPVKQTAEKGIEPPATDAIYLRADRKNVKVNLSDILFIESLKDYVKVVTKDRIIVTKQAISALEEAIPKSLFVRTHRSFIVSVSKVESFTADLIQIGRYEIPISRSYRYEVERAIAK